MKVLHVLLALYTFFAALNPCNDSSICVDDKKNGAIAINKAGHEHSSQEQDVCTPFCTCNCCAAQLSLSPVNSLKSDGSLYNVKFDAAYVETFIIADHRSIWQPPKI